MSTPVSPTASASNQNIDNSTPVPLSHQSKRRYQSTELSVRKCRFKIITVDVFSPIDNSTPAGLPMTLAGRLPSLFPRSTIQTEGKRPVLVVEYKAAHKLNQALSLEFEPARSIELDDVIHRHEMDAQENERQREIAEEVMAVIIT